MTFFSIALKAKIIELCMDAFFDKVTSNLTIVKQPLILKVGDRFSSMRSELHDVVDFTNVCIVDVGSTYVVFEADSVKHGNDIGGVIRARNHRDLMAELEEWDFVP
jgi:hypothetical protein